jgi:hypothetical protein
MITSVAMISNRPHLNSLRKPNILVSFGKTKSYALSDALESKGTEQECTMIARASYRLKMSHNFYKRSCFLFQWCKVDDAATSCCANRPGMTSGRVRGRGSTPQSETPTGNEHNHSTFVTASLKCKATVFLVVQRPEGEHLPDHNADETHVAIERGGQAASSSHKRSTNEQNDRNRDNTEREAREANRMSWSMNSCHPVMLA